MELKTMVVLQLAFDLLAGAVLLFCLLREQRSQQSEPLVQGLTREEIEEQVKRWEGAGRELLGLVEEKVRKVERAAEELDRAEIRACETLYRLERARQSLNGAQSAYGQAARWIRDGIPLEEVARRSGLGMGELRLMQGLSARPDNSRGLGHFGGFDSKPQ